MKFNNPLLALAAAPPIALAAFALMLGLGIPPVTAWFWPAPVTNATEAVALGDAARVRALAARGERLDLALPVRPGLVDGDAPPTMSPFEAAVRRRSEDSIVPVLLDLGVRPSPEEARRLYCLAKGIDATDAAERLETAFDLGATSCEG